MLYPMQVRAVGAMSVRNRKEDHLLYFGILQVLCSARTVLGGVYQRE
jgi:hypothetical protein